MRVKLRVGIVVALMAAGVAFGPGVRADIVETGTESGSTTSYADVCGQWSEATESGEVRVYACGSQGRSSGHIQAEREVCTNVGNRTECTGTLFERTSKPGEVAIDSEAGTGSIQATIDDCVIDVSVTATGGG